MKKIALITGANKGIGFAICQELVKEGIKVILTARNYDKGLAATQKIKSQNADIVFHQLDVTDDVSIKNCAIFIEKEFNQLDLLFNNAGLSGRSQGMIETSMEDIERLMRTNYFGPLKITRALYPFLKKSNNARVINISSKMGSLEDLEGNHAAYRLSKAALNAQTIMFANDFKEEGIKANAAHPGWVKTDIGGPDATRDPEKAAKNIIWIALEKNIGTAKFYFDKKEIDW